MFRYFTQTVGIHFEHFGKKLNKNIVSVDLNKEKRNTRSQRGSVTTKQIHNMVDGSCVGY